VTLSVSRKGECWDDAVAESFFATIKREAINDRAWPTWAGLHRAVLDYIEGWYNTAGSIPRSATSAPPDTT
jgi:putative transposase